jgi:hypothetical protein
METERAAPPALRWVVAFLAICGALGLWLGFKDQIRRNPPAWYTGAPDPVMPGAGSGDAVIRDATAFDPNADARPDPATTAARPQPEATETDEPGETTGAEAAETPAPATPGASTPTTSPAATPAAQPAPPRPRPTPAPRPAPSDDPVGDLLEAPGPSQGQPQVPY